VKALPQFRFAVIGAGTMGTNIALIFAARGHRVVVMDASPGQAKKSARTLAANAETLEAHGLLDAAPAAAVCAQVGWSSSLAEAVCQADWIVEAITEDLDAKQQLFRAIESHCGEQAVIWSNTSTFMPTALCADMRHPERMLVAHFWNPAHLIPLVEVVPHPRTQADVVARTQALLESCGKRPVILKREVPGFVGNRLAFALQREAMDLVQSGVVSADQVDAIVRTGFGRRIAETGIFGTADLGGLDVYLSICRLLFPHLSSQVAPPPLLEDLVRAGRLGMKTGAGWSTYDVDSQAIIVKKLAGELIRYAIRDRGQGEAGLA
jgi:3-hydroxybutyryl-CoA dehydrogenase